MTSVDLTRSEPSPTARTDGFHGSNVTRSLLGYLALAGSFYVVVSLVQAFTRTGFDPAEHEWSLLALGEHGWIQIANLILTGAMIVTGAIGLSRALPENERGRRAASRLLAGYGLCLVAAGVFTADPANGFPAGAPAGRPDEFSMHGTLHLVFGSIGFLCLIVVCFVVARIAARHSRSRAARSSVAVGVLFTCAFAGIASGASSAAVNLAFTGAVILSFAWLTWLAVALYRYTRRVDRENRS
jgi:Protein of unknown function (DUF998)